MDYIVYNVETMLCPRCSNKVVTMMGSHHQVKIISLVVYVIWNAVGSSRNWFKPCRIVKIFAFLGRTWNSAWYGKLVEKINYS